MPKILNIKLDKLELIKVKKSNSHALILYKILKNRDTKFSISHKSIPTLEEHIKFVISNPYRYWFIIKRSRIVLGSVYITTSNEVSISLLKNSKKNFSDILNLIIQNITPLPAIVSRRNEKFILNLSPNNKFYIKLLNNIGAQKIQETYVLTVNSI